MGLIWGRQDPGGPMLAPWTLLSGKERLPYDISRFTFNSNLVKSRSPITSISGCCALKVVRPKFFLNLTNSPAFAHYVCISCRRRTVFYLLAFQAEWVLSLHVSVRPSVRPKTFLCPHENSPKIWARITKFAPNMHPDIISAVRKRGSLTFIFKVI